MLKEIKIKKLFGRFNYSIKLKEAGITIITGPNGYGKSTLLTILDEFSNKSLEDVLKHTFDTLTLITDTNKLSITKLKESFKINEFSYNYPDKIDYQRILMDSVMKNMAYEELVMKKFFLNQIRREANAEDIQIDEFLESVFYQNRGKKSSASKTERKRVLSLIKEMKDEIGKVSFIKEQRLIEKRVLSKEKKLEQNDKVEYYTVVEENAQKLTRKIEQVMGMHSALANQLDSSYITRLFATESQMQKEEFDVELNKLKEKQDKLKHYGLAEIKNTSNLVYKPEFAKDLYVYFDDAKQKYDVFADLISKLDLYETIVNNKLEFKKMRLSREKGITIITNENTTLDLTSLSSGEQEILVLYYKLIFESDVNVLLIDEPEISLHVAWQKDILNDFKKIVALNKGIQVVISTHSPMLISGNLDINVDLGEQYNG